ncbi:hypothetical protein VUR80DRAFT_4142 [Thermomyces stellatus]
MCSRMADNIPISPKLGKEEVLWRRMSHYIEEMQPEPCRLRRTDDGVSSRFQNYPQMTEQAAAGAGSGMTQHPWCIQQTVTVGLSAATHHSLCTNRAARTPQCRPHPPLAPSLRPPPPHRSSQYRFGGDKSPHFTFSTYAGQKARHISSPTRAESAPSLPSLPALPACHRPSRTWAASHTTRPRTDNAHINARPMLSADGETPTAAVDEAKPTSPVGSAPGRLSVLPFARRRGALRREADGALYPLPHFPAEWCSPTKSWISSAGATRGIYIPPSS